MAISIYVISAICGNWWHESGVNPGIWEGLVVSDWTSLKHGYGLGQWTNTGNDTHGRLWKLKQYLDDNGYPQDSGEGQINYLIKENVWYPHADYPEFKTLSDFLNTDITDIEYLTHAYNRCWEGIHDSSWDTRVTYANNVYDYLLQHADDTSITTWISGNRYLSNSERYNNAVLAYRQLSGGVIPPDPPVPPTPGKRKKGMPLYFYLKRRI